VDVLAPDTFTRAVVVLMGVLALLGLLAWLVQRWGWLGPALSGRGRRIGVVEAAAVDGKRRLVLVRRDEVEHLVLTGPAGDVVIETGIRPPGGGLPNTGAG
jgi:flagellar protein FliO/FliZ